MSTPGWWGEEIERHGALFLKGASASDGWEDEFKLGPFFVGTKKGEVAKHGDGKFAGDGEAQAVAGDILVAVAAREAVEDEGLAVGVDGVAGVGDDDARRLQDEGRDDRR